MKLIGALLLSAALLAASACDDPSPTADRYNAIPAPTNEPGDPSDVYHAPDPPGGDVTAPSVAFSLPATANSLTVPLSLVALDDVGVSDYAVLESASGTAPAASSASWVASAPTSFLFSASGAHTLRAWARDDAGNVSAAASDTVTITDTTAPVVTVFTLTPPASGLIVAVSLTVTDEFGATGYLITAASSPAPAAADPGWSATKPTSYTAAASGALTLYAWAKDLAGNVSAAKSATATVP